MTENIVDKYLDQLDAQRRAAFAALDGLTDEQIWERPAPREWCIGEILSHTVRFFDTFLPVLKLPWATLGWYGRLRRQRPYRTEIEDVFRRPGFPMWVGFLFPPRHIPKKPVPLATLRDEVETAHGRVRAFYADKDPDVLGHVYVYDPLMGVANLIAALKVGIDHDRLHYDDVTKLASSAKGGAGPNPQPQRRHVAESKG